MIDDDFELRSKWELRAKNNGSDPKGVLYQGLGGFANDYLDKFHKTCLQGKFVESLPPGARVLDIGCGYGRFATALKRLRPDVDVIGLDFSSEFCHLFKNNTSEAVVCAELEHLPLREGCADALILLTSLMYVPSYLLDNVLANIVSLVRPGGFVFIIEPSQESIVVSGLLRPSAKANTTGGRGLYRHQFYRLFDENNCQLEEIRSVSFFTLMLPIFLLCRKFQWLIKRLGRVVWFFDSRSSIDLYIPLHRYALWKRRG